MIAISYTGRTLYFRRKKFVFEDTIRSAYNDWKNDLIVVFDDYTYEIEINKGKRGKI
jgi:hypothetical protein